MQNHIEVALIGHDGNAFAIMGKVIQALKNAGMTEDEIKRYKDEATSGDYNNLLAVTNEWVNIV
jgi:hypothetical protein